MWVDVDQCPPRLNIWNECEEPPEWIEIGPPDKQYAMKDIHGNVFIRGNAFIKRDLLDSEQLDTFTGVSYLVVDKYGDIHIEGNFYVGGDYSSAADFEAFSPYEPVDVDADGNAQIEGKFVCLGSIYTDNGDGPVVLEYN